jgi:hypothetical protein
MITRRLSEDLEAAITTGHSLRQIVATLRVYRDAGVSRREVLDALETLRAHVQDEATEDRILEVMDTASGFCSVENTVWPD